MKNLCLFVLILSACAPLASNNKESTGVVSTSSAGYYVLGTSDGVVEDQYLTAKVKGVSLRQSWRILEPTEGKYDWSYLDREINRLKNKGKLVMIHIKPGVDAPEWLKKKVTVFSYVDDNPNHTQGKTSPICYYKQTCRIPIPWDTLYLDKWASLQVAISKRYGVQGNIIGYHLAGPTDDPNAYRIVTDQYKMSGPAASALLWGVEKIEEK